MPPAIRLLARFRDATLDHTVPAYRLEAISTAFEPFVAAMAIPINQLAVIASFGIFRTFYPFEIMKHINVLEKCL